MKVYLKGFNCELEVPSNVRYHDHGVVEDLLHRELNILGKFYHESAREVFEEETLCWRFGQRAVGICFSRHKQKKFGGPKIKHVHILMEKLPDPERADFVRGHEEVHAVEEMNGFLSDLDELIRPHTSLCYFSLSDYDSETAASIGGVYVATRRSDFVDLDSLQGVLSGGGHRVPQVCFDVFKRR